MSNTPEPYEELNNLRRKLEGVESRLAICKRELEVAKTLLFYSNKENKKINILLLVVSVISFIQSLILLVF